MTITLLPAFGYTALLGEHIKPEVVDSVLDQRTPMGNGRDRLVTFDAAWNMETIKRTKVE